MLSSRGEIKIHEILEDAGFKFKEEYVLQEKEIHLLAIKNLSVKKTLKKK